ncbi:hypothetical protein HID58_090799 [Brassica napus]|uniref:Uncharacterized protein n=1 Tax=Brassica napus TaxID=3708 RepID=A0ABQ7XC31_BRANA|nr:hypothetical protein HID58_090799 [Brassica napus]
MSSVKGDMLMENIARLVLIILKGLRMDDKGNVYVADTLNLAIIGIQRWAMLSPMPHKRDQGVAIKAAASDTVKPVEYNMIMKDWSVKAENKTSKEF